MRHHPPRDADRDRDDQADDVRRPDHPAEHDHDRDVVRNEDFNFIGNPGYDRSTGRGYEDDRGDFDRRARRHEDRT